MAFMTKEIREGKDLYAAKQHEKNIRIAVDNGCPEKQAETIAKLCIDRHYTVGPLAGKLICGPVCWTVIMRSGLLIIC